MNTSTAASHFHNALDLTKRATKAAVNTTRKHIIPVVVTHSRQLAKTAYHFTTVTLPPHLKRAADATEAASKEAIRYSQDHITPELYNAGNALLQAGRRATIRLGKSRAVRIAAIALIMGGGTAMLWGSKAPSKPAPSVSLIPTKSTLPAHKVDHSSAASAAVAPAMLKTSVPVKPVETRSSTPPAVTRWKRVVVKGYSIPVPDGWSAASSSELKAYNEYLAECIRMQGGQHFDMDGRIVQNGSALGGLLGVNICVVPRAISTAELSNISANQDQLVREVDELQPWLHHMTNEGSYYDAKNDLLFSQTTSVGNDGRRMAYNGIVLFRDGLQVEIHGNSLINDKDNMAALVSLIASGVRKAE